MHLDGIRIAHLILAHKDPQHVGRLARRLSAFSDIFIHVDSRSNDYEFKNETRNLKNCNYVLERVHCPWGGWNAVIAEMKLLELTLNSGSYDRIVFLQGADYPLKTDSEIFNFFLKNKNTEFVRACCCTGVDHSYFHEKCRYILFYNKKSILYKIVNKITRLLRLKLRDGWIHEDDKKYQVYWGSAQWAITNKCAEYILDFYKNHTIFNKWFLRAFPSDELYVPTVVMNSKFTNSTTTGGPEPSKPGLTNWRNLHYFEYLPSFIKVFTERDFIDLSSKKELYLRKVNSYKSGRLLDMLDENNIVKDRDS